MRKTKVSWSDEDNERLRALVAAGATAIRAAGVFNRSTAAVKTQARKLGTPFPPIRVAPKK
jgi:GcrA cell cycle regulator